MKKVTYIVVGLLILAGLVYLIMTPGKPGKYDTFAQCVADSGAKFYGAFWCPHCQSQKAMFGKSSKLLPYIECSTPDSRGQLQVCKDAGVVSYPTWDFVVGSSTERMTGEIPLETLATKTNCELVVTE